MGGPEFWQTVMGHRFYEGDVPAIRRSLESINDALRDLSAAVNRLAFAEERARDDRQRCVYERSQRERDGDPFTDGD